MKNVHKGSHCWNLCSVNFTLLNCAKKYPLGLSLLEAEGKVFDCLVRPPTLKHVATIGDDVGDGDDDDNDDDDDDGDDDDDDDDDDDENNVLIVQPRGFQT